MGGGEGKEEGGGGVGPEDNHVIRSEDVCTPVYILLF